MAVPYDYMTAQRQSAQRQHPGSFADFGIPARPPVEAVAPPAIAPIAGPGAVQPAASNVPLFPDLIKQLEAKKGGRLNPQELMDAQSQYSAEILMPANIARGAKQFELEAIKAAFDNKANRFTQDYLSQPGAAGGDAANDEDFGLRRGLEATADTAVGVGSGVASFVPGVLSLVDLAYRYGPLGRAQHYVQQLVDKGLPSTDMSKEGFDDRMSYFGAAGRTPVGDLAAWLEGQRSQATEALTSQRTLDLRKERNDALPGDDAPFLQQLAAYVGETLKRPSVLSQDIGSGVGSLLSPGGAAAKGLKIAEAGAPLAARIMSRFVPAALVGTPQATVAVTRIEDEIYKRPLAELLKSEENQVVFDMLVDSGISRAAAEERLKDEIARKTMPTVIAAELAANVVLPALPGLGGAEQAITATGRRAGSRALRATRAGTSEALQEGTAGSIEQVGENVATNEQTGANKPLLAGTGRAFGEGAIAGGPVGGLTGLLPADAAPAAPVNPTNTPSANTPAPTATPTATPAVAPVAGKGVPQAELDVALSKLRNGIAVGMASKTSAVSKNVSGAKTAADVVQIAQAYASTAVGKAWANLDPLQQVSVIEAVATEFGKNKPFAAEIPNAIAGLRQAAAPAAAPAAPVVTQLPIPPGLINPEPTAPAATPEPVAATPEPTPAAAPTPASPAVEAATTDQQTEIFDALDSITKQGVTEEDLLPVVSAILEARAGKPEALEAQIKGLQPMNGRGKNVPLTPAQIKAIRKLAEQPAAKPATKPLRKKPVPTPPAATPTVEAAPPVEQTATPATPPKKGLRKKVPAPPKTEAPAPTAVAGAQGPETPSSAPPAESAPSASPSRETAAQAIERIFKGEVTDSWADELAEAMDLAREGDSSKLDHILKGDNLAVGDASGMVRGPTPAEKKAVRAAAKSLKPGERGETVDSQPAPAESEEQQASRVQQAMVGKNVEQMLNWLAENGPNPFYKLLARAMHSAVLKLESKGAKFRIDLTPLQRGVSGLTSSNIFSRSFVSVVQLNKNKPQIPGESHGASFETILHELVHLVTSNLITASVDPGPGLMNRVQNTKINEAIVELSEIRRAVLFEIRARRQRGESFPDTIIHGIQNMVNVKIPEAKGVANNSLQDIHEVLAWGLTNKEMQDFLRTVNVGPKQTAFSKFVGAVRKMLGMDEKFQSAFEKLLTVTETLLDPTNLDAWATEVADGGSFGLSEFVMSKWQQHPQLNGTDLFTQHMREERHPLPVSRWQTIGELFANMTYGLERAEQELRKLGGVVSAIASPYYAGRKYGSDQSEIGAINREEIINPIATWIDQNYKKFADTPDEFHKYSDQFLQAIHELRERIPDQWMQRVPLNNGQNIARDLLIEQAHNGEITPQEFYAQLTDLVNRNAATGLEEWAKQTHGIKELGALRALLADLKTRGYDENTLAEYNAQFDPARKRLQEHMLASGRIAQSDPWVAARGWKYYFPLKGTDSVSEDVADADYGSYSGKAKEFRSIQIKLAEGRGSFAGSVASQLISDMQNEGMKLAERHFKETLFSFVTDNIDKMGATKITTVRGTLRQGFTRDAIVRQGGKRVVVQKPVAAERVYTEPTYGFVYHNGDTHFIVELDPKNNIAGQLDRGVKGIRNVESPQGLWKLAGIGTNILARAYTTWAVQWQTMVGFLRDTNYIPVTLAMEIFDNPLKAGKFARGYAKRLALNTLNTFNVKQTFQEIAGRKDLLRAKAKAEPDSFIGQLFAFREAGGSTEFNQGLNPDLAYDELFGRANRRGLKGRVKQGYTAWNDATSNWAQLLENKGRVAAFATLTQDLGYEPEEAAALVKSVMDFGQSGQWGRKINSVFAFYRVGATSVDVMRRVFTTPEGKPNWAKLRNWSAFMATGAVTALAFAAAALGDDDEGKPRIRKYDLRTLTQKLVMPDGNGGVVTYPIGLGLPQLLMAPGTIAAMVGLGYATPAEGADAMYDTITRNLPFQPAGWVKGTGARGLANSWIQGFVPTTLRPVTETVANVNAFDAPIHTQNYNKNKFRSDQGMQVTPQEWKDLANEIRELTLGAVDMFPEDIRHMSKGYGGQLVSEAMRWAADYDAQEAAGIDSNAVRTSLRIGASDEQYYYSRELKKTEDILLNTRRRYNAAEDSGSLIEFNRNPANARRLAALKELESAKEKYYAELNRIRESNISLQGKRDRRKLADSALRRAVESAQRVVEVTQ